MNVSRLPSLIALFLFAFGSSLTAQTPQSGSEEILAANTYLSMSGTSPATVTATATATLPYHFHKKLPQLFSGFAIEIAASNYPLDNSNPVFRQFGNIHYEKLREGGYSYLILGKFSSKESALHFVETIIKPKTEHARLFEYKDGIRKVIRG